MLLERLSLMKEEWYFRIHISPGIGTESLHKATLPTSQTLSEFKYVLTEIFIKGKVHSSNISKQHTRLPPRKHDSLIRIANLANYVPQDNFNQCQKRITLIPRAFSLKYFLLLQTRSCRMLFSLIDSLSIASRKCVTGLSLSLFCNNDRRVV